MTVKKYLFILIATILGQTAFSQVPFQEQNVNYVYDINGELLLDHLISFHDDDSFKLVFTVSVNALLEGSFDSIYTMSAVYRADYKSEEALDSVQLPFREKLLESNQKDFCFQYQAKNEQEARLLELYITNKVTDREYVFDISLDEGLEYGNDSLLKYKEDGEFPLLRNFININEPFFIKDEANDTSEIWVYYYDSDFDIAVPPMIVDYKSTSKSLTVNKLSKFKPDSVINFTASGLYFVQKDTSSLEGIGFRIEEKPFPKLGTYKSLVQPLKYISTKEEYDNFENGTDLERKFQRFWIERSDSEAAAKNSISNFYKRVAEANFFFSGYKEGWKTDMGMIYIIYGAPDRVFRHEEYEEWIYHQSINLPALRFTFVKIKNVFSHNHYTLVRDKKFDKHWFRAVELWRTGKK